MSITRPYINVIINLLKSPDQSTFNWQVLSYLHHRRVVWEVESYSLNSLNDLMMEIFRSRLSEGYQVSLEFDQFGSRKQSKKMSHFGANYAN